MISIAVNARKRLSILLACMGLLASPVPVVAEAEYAMQMRGAAESMLLDIAVAGDRLVVVGERGHILYSEDQGASWVQAQVPTRVMLNRVFFIDDTRGWAVGHDGNILYSQDGGVTWVVQRDGLADQAQINEQRAGRARVQMRELEEERAGLPEEQQAELDEAIEEALWALDNARELMNEPLYAPPLMDVLFSSDSEGWAVGAYGMLLHTGNGGRSWQDWSHKVGNVDELHLNGISRDADGNLYLASEWGTVFVSGNAGENWRAVETGYEGSFFGVQAGPAGSDSVYAYGLLGTIYISTDRGETWEEGSSGVSASLFGAAAFSSGVIFVGQGGVATLTADGGNSFTPMIQSRRAGLFGVAPLANGEFMATGQGGSRILEGAQ